MALPVQSSLSVVFALVALAFAGLAIAAQEEPPASAADCVHEIEYEAFAGLILVPVELGDGLVLDFVLDSGANHSAVNDPDLAVLAGLEVREAGLARGMGSGAARVGISQPVAIRAAGREILRTPLAIHDIGVRLAAVAGREIDGLLGWELFERYVVELDPVRRRMFLYEAETFEYRGRGLVVPLTVEDRRPVVEASVWVGERRPVRVRLLLDTGSSNYLALINGSRRRLVPDEDVTRGTTRVGVVGTTRPVAGTIHRLELGAVTVDDLEVAWVAGHSVPAARSITKLNGILGNRLLGRFRVVIDYRRGRLILEAPSGRSDGVTEKPD